MERRRAQSDDLFDFARRSAANIFIRDRSGKAFREELFAESRARDFGNRDRWSGKPAHARSGVDAFDRDRMEPRNAIAFTDDAGIGESLARNRPLRFSAPARNVV